MDKKTRPKLYATNKTHLKNKGQTDEKDGERYTIPTLWMRAGMTMLVSEKQISEQKNITRDKDHFVMLKGSVQQEDISLVLVT